MATYVGLADCFSGCKSFTSNVRQPT